MSDYKNNTIEGTGRDDATSSDLNEPEERHWKDRENPTFPENMQEFVTLDAVDGSELKDAESELKRQYEIEMQRMELEKVKIALEIRLKKEQQRHEAELKQMRQELASLGEPTPDSPGTFDSHEVGLAHSTPLSTQRAPQGIRSPLGHTDVSHLLDATQRQHQALVENLQLPKTRRPFLMLPN